MASLPVGPRALLTKADAILGGDLDGRSAKIGSVDPRPPCSQVLLDSCDRPAGTSLSNTVGDIGALVGHALIVHRTADNAGRIRGARWFHVAIRTRGFAS